MPSTIYSDILRQAATSTRFKYGDVELRDWFRDKAMDTINITPSKIMERKGSKANEVVTPRIGRMLVYRYDPKHKLTLPYYDTFPVIFPIEQYDDGWLGINLHYLPPVFRARLMDSLYDTLNNQRYDARSRLQITYKILNSASKMRYFKPCVKRYLKSHVKSQLIEIDIKEWDYVMFLPLARFKKSTQREVWDASVRQIMK